MKKKLYIKPSTDLTNCVAFTAYLAGDNSVPWGGDDGPGVAESKDRDAFENEKETGNWGNLW